ncbi:histidine kinase [Babesia caballi]|uniref:Histidine kinase n=1 Tax=Babesia caballi TaxID=5871 RepID=A0AAV4LTH0_BABCB|nr:histidine kinase [Babesia caballi]
MQLPPSAGFPIVLRYAFSAAAGSLGGSRSIRVPHAVKDDVAVGVAVGVFVTQPPADVGDARDVQVVASVPNAAQLGERDVVAVVRRSAHVGHHGEQLVHDRLLLPPTLHRDGAVGDDRVRQPPHVTAKDAVVVAVDARRGEHEPLQVDDEDRRQLLEDHALRGVGVLVAGVAEELVLPREQLGGAVLLDAVGDVAALEDVDRDRDEGLHGASNGLARVASSLRTQGSLEELADPRAADLVRIRVLDRRQCAVLARAAAPPAFLLHIIARAVIAAQHQRVALLESLDLVHHRVDEVGQELVSVLLVAENEGVWRR